MNTFEPEKKIAFNKEWVQTDKRGTIVHNSGITKNTWIDLYFILNIQQKQKEKEDNTLKTKKRKWWFYLFFWNIKDIN